MNLNANKDEKLTPLLKDEIDKEFDSLSHDKLIFLSTIQDLEEDIKKQNLLEFSMMQKVKNKFQNIKSHMEKIFDKVHFIENYIKDDVEKLNATKQLLDKISATYDKTNTLFTEVMRKTMNNIQYAINNQNLEQTVKTKSQNEEHLSNQIFKNQADYERLKSLQIEYEKILQSSEQLAKLSREIKIEAEKQGETILLISDHIISAEGSTKKANAELNERRASTSTNTSRYFWISLILIFVIIVVSSVFYLKYFKSQ